MPKIDYDKTIIRFKFLKPMGIAIGDKPAFSPARKVMYRENVPGHVGRFPFEGYDFDEVFEFELPDEYPKELPDVFEGLPPEVRTQYHAQAARAMAETHAENNKIRAEFRTYEKAGYIIVIEDTFMDRVSRKTEPERKGPKGGDRGTAPTEPTPE